MTKPSKVLLFTLVAAISIPTAVIYTGATIAAKENHQINKLVAKSPAIEVSVVPVVKSSYQASVTGYGEAQPQYQLSLSAEISGRVTRLSDQFVTGKQVQKGELLATINPNTYQQALATAKNAVADAELALMEEQRQGEQARLEWQQSGMSGEPDSPLVLRKPQLQAAQTKLEQAQKQLISAQYDLDNTEIRTPFDALIVSRDIQPGSYIQADTQIAMLYSISRLEVIIPLSAGQWQNLPDPTSLAQKHWPVQLTDSSSNDQWEGYVDRVTQHINSETRQRNLIVVVDLPLSLEKPFYPGTFSRVKIQGKQIDDLWRVPASAISQDNMLWLVNDQQQLVQIPAQIIFSEKNDSFVLPPKDMDKANVVVRPLNTYLAGIQVNTKPFDSELGIAKEGAP
ncbi:MAG: efflux RND transporter periplasmic adaptor subunit [Porticoccus sp.]|nr:efflux RND transporter periplasmic adaptor subunit [Porticoccus sp.]